MKVLILEIGGSHIECIYTFVHLLQLKQREVYLACNEKLLSLFPEKNRLAGILPLPDKIDGIDQFKIFLTIRKYIKKNKIDHLVINTTEPTLIRNFSFFIPRKVNCTGLVHYAKKLESSFTFTKILSKKIRKYFVLGDFLLQQITPARMFKVAPFYPVYFPAPAINNIVKPTDQFWITIPGEAEQKRRDYQALIDQIKDKRPAHDIKFIFLGKYKLQDIVAAETHSKAWWKEHIIHFNGMVDHDSFHNYIRQSDIILPLIKLQGDDIYGQSRISGSFNLGLGYHKPFLLPQTYDTNTDLAPYSIYYSSIEDLIKKVDTLRKEPAQLQELNERYTIGKFKDVDDMADEVISFISLKLPL